MAISLYDLMRPVALFGGMGAACSTVPSRDAGVLGYAAAISGALVAGLPAFWLSQAIAKRLQPLGASELILLVVYVTVFLGIALAAFGGGIGLLSLSAAV